MGIFDTPAVSIRKRLPQEALEGYDKCLSYVESVAPDAAMSKTQAAYIVGVAMGTIVVDSFRHYDDIPIPDNDLEYIEKMTLYYLSLLGKNAIHAAVLIRSLQQDNFIQELPEWAS